MKLQSKNRGFDRALQSSCGWMYGRELATLLPEQLRMAQTAVDLAGKLCMGGRDEYVMLKSAVNRALQARQ